MLIFLVWSVYGPDSIERYGSGAAGGRGIRLSSFGEHAQTVRDTNKSY